MKKPLLFIGLLLLLGCTSEKNSESGKSAAPSFTVQTLDGQAFESTQLKGTVVVVDFWATWCQPCIREIPNYNALYNKYRDSNFTMLGITMDSGPVSHVKSAVEKFGIEYPIFMGDKETTAKFGGILGYPTTLVINQDWQIVARFTGMSSDKVAEIVGDLLKDRHRSDD